MRRHEHGRQEVLRGHHLKVYLKPGQKRRTSPVVYQGAQVVVGSPQVARAGRVKQVVLVERLGAAQIQRMNVPNGDHRVPGSHRSHGSEKGVPLLRRHFQGRP